MDSLALVDCYAVHVVQAVLVLQQPGVCLYQCLGQAAVEPFLHGGGAELATLLDHHLQCVGQLEFAPGADVVIHQVLQCRPERLDILDVVDADDGFVAHDFLGLFDQALDAAFGIGHGDAEAVRVFYFVRIKDVLACVREALDVCLEQCVPEDDEQRFVVAHVGERKAYRLAEPLRVALQHGAGLAPLRAVLQELFDSFGLVAGDENSLCRVERERVGNNPVDDGLAADGQQALGQVVGVGAHALAFAGNGQNDLHIISFFGIAAALWATAIRGGKCRKMFPIMRRAASPKDSAAPCNQGGGCRP